MMEQGPVLVLAFQAQQLTIKTPAGGGREEVSVEVTTENVGPNSRNYQSFPN